MENVYLSKLQEYSVQKIRETAVGSNVNFTGQQFDGADYAEVHSTVLLKDKPPPIKVDQQAAPDIAWVAWLGAAVDPESAPARPYYLRAPDAKPPKDLLSGASQPSASS
jgi:hypothetical protein